MEGKKIEKEEGEVGGKEKEKEMEKEKEKEREKEGEENKEKEKEKEEEKKKVGINEAVEVMDLEKGVCANFVWVII